MCGWPFGWKYRHWGVYYTLPVECCWWAQSGRSIYLAWRKRVR